MRSLQEVLNDTKPQSAFKRLYEGLLKPSLEGVEPTYCPFCLKEKLEYLNPNTGMIRILQCECEKYFYMLKDFITTGKDVEKAKKTYEYMQNLKAENLRRLKEAE